MKTEVYSWRVSAEVKADLEREARARKVPISTILDRAIRDWLKINEVNEEGEEAQRRLHASAGRFLGVLAGGNPRRAEAARAAVRARLRRRNAR